MQVYSFFYENYIELAKTRVGVAMQYSSKCIFEGIVTYFAMCQNLLISMSGLFSYLKWAMGIHKLS